LCDEQLFYQTVFVSSQFQLDNNPLTTTGAMDLIETLSDSANSAVVNLSLKVIIARRLF
jgi:hypothetical protein